MSNRARSRKGKHGNTHGHGPASRRGNAHGSQLVTQAPAPEAPPIVVKDPASFAKAMPGLVSVESPASSKPAPSKPNGERPTLPDAPTVLSVKERLNGETKHKSNGEAREKLNGEANGKLNGEAKAHEAAKASQPAKSVEPTKSVEPASKEPVRAKEAAEGKGPKAKEPETKTDPTVDEISIPPVGDLEDEKFFAQGAVVEKEHARAAVHAEPVLELEPDPKVVHKMRPEVRERRARFTRIVQGVVVGLMVLCVVAAYAARRSRALAANAPTKKAAPAPVVAAVEPPARPQTVAAVDPPPPEPAASQGAAEPPPAAEPAATAAQPSEKSAEGAKAEAPVAADQPAAEPPAKTAAEEKHDAQVALERGQVKKAIEAGERSVALDETDGDAWLLLGAAYEMAGKNGEARRCFTACLKQGKKGRLGECRAMLH